MKAYYKAIIELGTFRNVIVLIRVCKNDVLFV